MLYKIGGILSHPQLSNKEETLMDHVGEPVSSLLVTQTCQDLRQGISWARKKENQDNSTFRGIGKGSLSQDFFGRTRLPEPCRQAARLWWTRMNCIDLNLSANVNSIKN